VSWPVPGALLFVCPRYGREVLGGAETVVRAMAGRLAARGLDVEVGTTCAIDHHTWENAYAQGAERIDGVTVHRFQIQRGEGRLHRAIGERIGAGVPTSYEEQELWINDGFRCAGLFHWLLDDHDRFHTILLTPYMFWTTYACAQIAPHRNVLRPCLHDEPFARLDIYRPLFRDARGVLFNSPPEADLARELFELPASTQVVGEGIDIPASVDGERFRAKYDIHEPFLVYGGRREYGKNVDWLVELFARYSALHNPGLRLVLYGRGDVRIPDDARPRVLDVGFLDEQDKWDALAAADVVCQPSRWESFSRLLMEGWVAGTPALTFGGCAVTAYHTIESGGGLVFDDEVEFALALDVLLGQPELAAQMGRSGRRYVEERYTWDGVVDRFAECVGGWAAAAPEAVG
jgi:glycosyltransferase involved in cell wall biosynthesis